MPLDESVKAGDPLDIKAETWNALMSGLRKFRQSKDRIGILGPHTDLIRSNLDVLVMNAVGDDLFGMFRVVRLGYPTLDLETNPLSAIKRICIDGLEPNDSTNQFAILQGPVAEDEIVRGVIQGLTLAFVMVEDDAHEYCNPTPSNSEYLTSAETGSARILWRGEIDPDATEGIYGPSYEYTSGPLQIALVFIQGVGSSGSSSTGISIAEVDGTPTYSDVLSITVDQSDGFRLTQPGGAGTARLDIAPASATDTGVITTGTQDIVGDKTFYSQINILAGGDGVYIYNSGDYGELRYNELLFQDSAAHIIGRVKYVAGTMSLWAGTNSLTIDSADAYFTSGFKVYATNWGHRTALGVHIDGLSSDGSTVHTGGMIFKGGVLTSCSFAKGDLLVGISSTILDKLPLSVTDGQVLTVDNSVASGIKWASAGTGTVTTVSVATANGFAGSVATATSTPVITISTTITGLLKGDGTTISAAVANTDYTNPSGLAAYAQPLDATLTALAGANWAANALPIGSGSDTLSQISFAANTFPARASTGNLVAKTITDFGLSLVDDADASAARTTLGLVIGTDVAAFSHTHAAADIVSGTIATARLGSGSASSANVLKGDQTWGTLPVDITGLTKDTPVATYEVPIYRTLATVGNKKATFGEVFGAFMPMPGGRLTLASSDPIGENTGTNSLSYTPYLYPFLPLYDGTRWVMTEFSTHTVTGAVLSGLTSGKPYDVFAYLNSGAIASEILVWTNDTTRATGLTLTNGLRYKTGDMTRLYLGSFYSASTTTTKDTPGSRYLWNAHNEIPYSDWANDSTDSWTNNGNGTWSAMNSGNAAWIHSHMIGVSARPITAELTISGTGSAGFATMTADGSTTLDRAVASVATINVVSGPSTPSAAFFSKVHAEGKRSVTGMQTSYAAGSITFYGDNGATIGSSNYGQSNGMRVRGFR